MLTTTEKNKQLVPFNRESEFSVNVFGRDCESRQFDWIWKNNDWCNLTDLMVPTDESVSSDFLQRRRKSTPNNKRINTKKTKKVCACFFIKRSSKQHVLQKKLQNTLDKIRKELGFSVTETVSLFFASP